MVSRYRKISFKVLNNIVTFVTHLLSSNVGHSKSCIYENITYLRLFLHYKQLLADDKLLINAFILLQ